MRSIIPWLRGMTKFVNNNAYQYQHYLDGPQTSEAILGAIAPKSFVKGQSFNPVTGQQEVLARLRTDPASVMRDMGRAMQPFINEFGSDRANLIRHSEPTASGVGHAFSKFTWIDGKLPDWEDAPTGLMKCFPSGAKFADPDNPKIAPGVDLDLGPDPITNRAALQAKDANGNVHNFIFNETRPGHIFKGMLGIYTITDTAGRTCMFTIHLGRSPVPGADIANGKDGGAIFATAVANAAEWARLEPELRQSSVANDLHQGLGQPKVMAQFLTELNKRTDSKPLMFENQAFQALINGRPADVMRALGALHYTVMMHDWKPEDTRPIEYIIEHEQGTMFVDE